MTFIDFFAGIGGFRRGLELAGHKCVGFCEFDKFAVASYTSMHLITDEQREYLSTLDLKARQKEILKDEYRNGEWFSNDIRRVDADSMPRADIWCFGFPCQDISIAGKQLGFTGNRSSLFFRVMYLLGQLKEEERPSVLFIENVKNLLSVNGGWDFARLLIAMDENGYDAEWSVLNSKDYGVPQNRERCFIIGHFRGRGRRVVFPFGSHDTEAAELQGREDRNRVVSNTLDTRIEALTRGTYPIVEGGGTAVKVSGYHKE
jgi:DNA (cytosine-5)-methyltransferase 1